MANTGPGSTYIGTGAPASQQWHSVALLAESLRQSQFVGLMTGPQASEAMAYAKKRREETSGDMPLMMIRNLEKNKGDLVSYTLSKVMQGYGHVGDDTIEGKGIPLDYSEDSLKINQIRQVADAGATMTIQRTEYDLEKQCRADLTGWFARMFDQVIQCHLAGARGNDTGEDWTVPTEAEDSARLARLMINPLRPPSNDRYFIAGQTTAAGSANPTEIGTTDVLSLDDLRRIVTHLRQQSIKLPAVSMRSITGRKLTQWCLFVTENQWRYLSEGRQSNQWRQLVAAGNARQAEIGNHPLFTGECAEFEGLIIKRIDRPISFSGGDKIEVFNSSTGMPTEYTVPTVNSDGDPINLTIHRALLVGGQAMAMAFGNAVRRGRRSDGGTSGGSMTPYPMRWTQEWHDHSDKMEVAAATMFGCQKTRFEHTDGRVRDFGVAVIDSYAPDPMSKQGESLMSSFRMSN